MSRTLNGWPVLTLAGITCAVAIALVHASLSKLTACVLGLDDISPHADNERGSCA